MPAWPTNTTLTTSRFTRSERPLLIKREIVDPQIERSGADEAEVGGEGVRGVQDGKFVPEPALPHLGEREDVRGPFGVHGEVLAECVVTELADAAFGVRL